MRKTEIRTLKGTHRAPTKTLISAAFTSLRSQSIIPHAFLLPLKDSCIINCRICVTWYSMS